MSKQGDKPSHNSRREFLQKIGYFGAGTLLAGSALFTGINYDRKKKHVERIKVLTAQNELLLIDKNDTTKITKSKKQVLTYFQKLGREGQRGKRWVMVIDLSKCRNAQKCMTACQGAHHLRPEQSHINTLKMQESRNTPPFYMPKPCQHCDNPPCVSVCPVDATFKRQDGIVLIDNKVCIGCRFCIAACPYSARVLNWTKPLYDEEDKDLTYNVELNVPQLKGTITKCLFSADRLRIGKLPYCVEACPNGVFYFGDENEDAVTNGTTKETVRFRQLIDDNGGYRLMPELGTEPRVYYLPAKGNAFPFDPKDLKDARETIDKNLV